MLGDVSSAPDFSWLRNSVTVMSDPLITAIANNQDLRSVVFLTLECNTKLCRLLKGLFVLVVEEFQKPVGTRK